MCWAKKIKKFSVIFFFFEESSLNHSLTSGFFQTVKLTPLQHLAKEQTPNPAVPFRSHLVHWCLVTIERDNRYSVTNLHGSDAHGSRGFSNSVKAQNGIAREACK